MVHIVRIHHVGHWASFVSNKLLKQASQTIVGKTLDMVSAIFKLHLRVLKSVCSKLQFCAISQSTAKIDFDETSHICRNYNYARDWFDKIAAEPGTARRNAIWWVDDIGNEIKISFADVSEYSKRLADSLESSCGINKGDRVILLLPRTPHWSLFMLAGFRSGIVPISCTPMLTVKDIKHRLEASNAKVVATTPDLVAKMESGLSGNSNVHTKIVCPLLSVDSTASSIPGWINFNKLLADGKSSHQCISNDIDDTLMIYFTSGTTGLPKMVDLPHYYPMGHQISTQEFSTARPEDLSWTLTDPGWVATNYGTIFGAWFTKTCLYLYHPTKVPMPLSAILETLQKYPITHFGAPPMVYRLLLEEKLPAFREKSQVRDFMTGGEALNAETFLEWKRKTGYEIRQLYGQTETTGLIGNIPGSRIKPGSAGKRLGGNDICIINEEMKELGQNEEGQVAIRVDPKKRWPLCLFRQYIDAPAANKKSFRGGWYLTGDRGYFDDDADFFFCARDDDVINASGYRIGPVEVESVLLEHPSVLEAAAVQSPCPKRGSVVKAFIVLKAAYKDADKSALTTELQNHVKKVTAPYKYPRKIEFIDELPKTISQKIRRSELKEREYAGQAKKA